MMNFYILLFSLMATHAIANQCPLSHGSAVFQARSLLSLVGNASYDDEALCANSNGQGEGPTALKKQDAGFNLYPNPAQGEVTLFMPKHVEGGKVVISNNLGETVLDIIVNPDGRTLTLKTDMIGTGLFIFTLYDDGEVLFTEKLIVVK